MTDQQRVSLKANQAMPVEIHWASGPADTIFLRIAQGYPSYDPKRSTINAQTAIDDSGWKTTPRRITFRRGQQERVIEWELAQTEPQAVPEPQPPVAAQQASSDDTPIDAVAWQVLEIAEGEVRRIRADWPDGHVDVFLLTVKDGIPTFDMAERSGRTGTGNSLDGGVRKLAIYHHQAPYKELSWRAKAQEQAPPKAFERVPGPVTTEYSEAWKAFEVSDAVFNEGISNAMFIPLNDMVDGMTALARDHRSEWISAPQTAETLMALASAMHDFKGHHLWNEYGVNANNSAMGIVNHLRYCIDRESNHYTPKGESSNFAEAKVMRLKELHEYLAKLKVEFEAKILARYQSAEKKVQERSDWPQTQQALPTLKSKIDFCYNDITSTLAAIAQRINLIQDLIDYWAREGFHYND